MSTRDELLRHAAERRLAAVQTRRLANGVSLKTDRDRLMQQAAEIEAEAKELERQAAQGEAMPPMGVTNRVQQQQVQQQQVQQQQSTDQTPDPTDPTC